MAGTVTLTRHKAHGLIRRLVFDCVADASNGSIPATALPPIEGRLLALLTNPGATAPTDEYDITLVDGEGADRLHGAGADRSTSATEYTPIVFAETALHPPVAEDETLTLTFANQAVNSATVRVVVVYTPAV